MLGKYLLFTFVYLGVFGAASETRIPNRKLKILVNSPALGFSHSQFQGKLVDILIDAGHEVHMLISEINPLIGNFTGSKNVHKVYFISRPSAVKTDFMKTKVLEEPFGGPGNSLFDGTMDDFMNVMMECTERLLAKKDLMEELRAQNYDVGISEVYEASGITLFQYLNIPTKLASLAVVLYPQVMSNFGIPVFSSFIQSWHDPAISGTNMNFFERAYNLFTNVYDLSVDKAIKEISLIFTNSNAFLDLPKPISSKVVYIGGIVESKVTKKLTEDVEKILNKAKKGAVLLSFGSISDTTKMKPEMRNSMFGAFAKFPDYEFIVKWSINGKEEEQLIANLTNVHALKWVDQRAILQHPKLKLFITHCGLNSFSEGSANGVPMIAIPLFGDQPYNAAIMNYKRTGKYLNILSLTDQNKFVDTIQEVLTNPIYKENAIQLQRKMALIPFDPKEKLIKYVEFAAEFSDFNELNLPSTEMSSFVYYSLDVISALLTFIALSGISIYLILRLLWKNIFGNEKAKKD